MRLVSGRHFDDVEHQCADYRQGPPPRCWAYTPNLSIANGKPKQMEFCMDMFEAPNQRGARAIVMKTFSEASKWCEAKSKRICSEFEWETACESGDELPWFYGWAADRTICNSDKPWKQFDAAKLASNGDSAKTEADRLWQGTPSGAVTTCQTRDGIYDLLGNVEEWVSSSRKRKFAGALMGGFWAKPWTGCRGTNDAHEPNFRFYEVGFRCCGEADRNVAQK
jgi:formylglycine-generating enzyme required for sulfatase activity